ncbi:hypothetical protein GW17_00022922 [Ensete ventricosum]|nr:hypothetical protein GW17_00022922 [Ensete ventricosum]
MWWCWLRRRSLMESYGSARTETVFSIGGPDRARPACHTHDLAQPRHHEAGIDATGGPDLGYRGPERRPTVLVARPIKRAVRLGRRRRKGAANRQETTLSDRIGWEERPKPQKDARLLC